MRHPRANQTELDSKPKKQPPPSWTPGQPLPDDPSKLGPDWKPDPKHDPKGKSGDKRYVNDKTGDKLDWHKGQPGEKKWQGRDHWHWLPGGEKEKTHYEPGDTIKRYAPAAIVVGIALGVAETIVETAPVWVPFVLAF
jgi:hypothetical protein